MEFENKQFFLSVNDYSVSGEQFELYRDENLDLLITSPKPCNENLGRYYESEDYISHTDGKRSLFESVYQFVKSIALSKKVKLLNELSPQKGNALDIGTGTGDFLKAAKINGWNVQGSEPNQKARIIAVGKGLDVSEQTSDFESHSFDVITMWHVLEHVPDLQEQIHELKRLLKPDGTIIIAVPNFNSYDANHYGEFWAAYDVPRHLWHFSKTSIKKIFAEENIRLHKTLPMRFDSFYVSLLSEKYKTKKMNLFSAFITGLRSNISATKTGEYSSHIYILKMNNN